MTQVLVASGDATIARMLRLTLRTSGFEVQAADLVEDAIGLIERERFDAVVLDLDVAIASLDLLVRALHAHDERTPVVVMSSDAMVDRSQIDADAFIRKPFRPEALVATLDTLTRSQRSAPAGS